MVGFNLSATLLVCLLAILGNDASSVTGSSTFGIKIKTLPPGYVAYPDIGLAYKMYNTPTILTIDARNLCAADGAQMAVVDTPQKVGYLMALMPANDHWMHGGMMRIDDKWVDVNTGMFSAILPWGQNEVPRDGDRLYLHRDSRGVGAWPNVNGHIFACQLPVSENNLVISISY